MRNLSFIRRKFFLGILFIVFSFRLFSQELILTPEMVVSLKNVTQISISPDGNSIAYTLRVPRDEGEEPGPPYSEIWLISIDGTVRKQFTSKPVSSWSPEWRPDGKAISFLSKRKEHDPNTQIYIMPVDGGTAKILTHHETSIISYKWSPDGRWIAYIAVDPMTDEEKLDKKAGRDWIVADRNFKHRRLWILNMETGESRKLFEDDLSVWDFEWSPDGKGIVFQASKTPKIDDSYMFKQIYFVSIDDGRPELVCRTEGKLGGMTFSPDGKRLAFLGATSLNDPLAQSLFVVEIPKGTPKNLTKGYKGSAIWTGWLNNKTILMLANEGTYTALYKVDPETGKRSKILGEGPILTTIDINSEMGLFVAIAHTPEHPREVYAGNLKTGKLRRLTNHNPELDKVKLAKQEVFKWKGADGWDMEGILTYPIDYEEGKRYPLILQIHGGPEGINLNGWTTRPTYPVQLIAARGYFVFQPNYRGSGGRGVEFSKADHNDLGGKEFEDVLKGIDALVKKGLVDPDKVGTGGWSYGGYFSAWAATRYSERFKAAVVCAGLSNWISFTGTTDIPYEMSIVHWNSWWYDYPELHWERSPIAHINKARTPTLIVHGLADERVHPEQSMELYTAMKLKGITTELVLYPREPHGLLEREHQLDFIRRMLNWFDRYVKGVVTKSEE